MASFKPRDPTPISIIPEDVAAVFDEVDIEKTWDYLEKIFRLNKKKWKPAFEEMLLKSTREYSKVELFVRFGKKNFEPAINTLLFRGDHYPTWINLVRFIVKDKIKEAEQERGRIAKMYGRSSSYKIYNRNYQS